MILIHEYPLSIVDHLGFKRFCCALQPLFKVPCIKKEILTLYELTKTKIQREIDGNRGRVAVKTDMWTTTNQKRGYMAITAHYIDNSWKLRSILLRFLYVPAPHTSVRLANCLCASLLDWNIDSKFLAITLDNCTTNDSVVSIIRNKLVPSNLLMDGSLLHMRCSAHILNLIVRDGLNVIKDGIDKIRETVSYWVATLKRFEFFIESARHVDVNVKRKLVLDCPTRWNSTYEMLIVSIPYKDVLYLLRLRDHQYDSVPSSVQWEFATAIVEKLKIIAETTELFSDSSYPTANMFFSKVCDHRLELMNWHDDSNSVISEMARTMWLQFTKYWDDIHLVLAVAVVLDPRYKLHLIGYYATKLGITNSYLVGDSVKKIVCDLVLAYQTKYSSQVVSSYCSTTSATDLDFELFMSQRKRLRTTLVTTELDHYLAEQIIPRTLDFDILLWWKLNGAKYPTLQQIARDFLAIPIDANRLLQEGIDSTPKTIYQPHENLTFETGGEP
ncbi:Zinc finger BED domain-containing protein RICESLEEPER 2 [Linum perenne]